MAENKLERRLAAIFAADAVGYSRLMAADDHATVVALDAARGAFRRQIELHGGRVIDTAGDSVLAVFGTATGAVKAALAGQKELAKASSEIPASRRLLFRIGVHLGDVIVKADGTVYGDGVNIAARLQSHADPGGLTVSDAVRGAVRNRITATFVDQGEQAVKNIPEPVRAFRVQIGESGPPPDNEASREPSLTAVHSGNRTAAPAGNLSFSTSPLFGRERDVAIVSKLLGDTRLLTLTGAGGVGKTRFACEIATAVASQYRDGVWLVELAPLADPALVPQTVASALNVHEEPDQQLWYTLLAFLRSRQLLIVLDNCEHLIDACAQAAERVVRATGQVRVLATSREALGIEGERVWRVPSLASPEETSGCTPLQLMQFPATQLFVQRASAASPDFQLTQQNASSVAQICRRLDGIPLAIELAAARVNAMRVDQIAERLHDRFALLTRGSRTAMQRHQTLRSMVDWSHELLSESERIVLRRLSVFANGWTLEAAEAVCSGADLPDTAILDPLSRLVEKSLVVLDERGVAPHYRMLETIRQYGMDKLVAAGEAEALRQRHLVYFSEFAERARIPFYSREQARWNAIVDGELDNIRVALEWALRPDGAELGLHIINSLHRYWYQNMYWSEAAKWIERLCSQATEQPFSQQRVRSLYVSAMLTSNFDPPTGRRLCEECLEASRASDYHEGIAWSLMWLGYLDSRKRDPATRQLFTESLASGRSIPDPWRRAALLTQAMICQAGYEALMGHADAVPAIVRDCEAEIARMGDDILYTGHCRALLGTLATRQGDFERASRLLQESLALYRSVDSKFDIAGSLVQQGFLELRRGRPIEALGLFKESLPLHRNYPMSPWVTRGLAHLVIAYAACEQWGLAARLAGALRGSEGTSAMPPVGLSRSIEQSFQDAVAAIRSALGEEAFRLKFESGVGMTREEAMNLALTG